MSRQRQIPNVTVLISGLEIVNGGNDERERVCIWIGYVLKMDSDGDRFTVLSRREEQEGVDFLWGSLIVCMIGFLTSSSSARLSRDRVLNMISDNYTCCHTDTELGDHLLPQPVTLNLLGRADWWTVPLGYVMSPYDITQL